MGTPEAYDPCPCGSGKKYKFCCRASGKFNSPSETEPCVEYEDGLDPTLDTLGDNERSPFLAYAEPLLSQTDGSEMHMKAALEIAMTCQLVSLLPEGERETFLEEIRGKMNLNSEEYREFRHEVIDPMIRRHQQMFPGTPLVSRSIIRNESV